MLNVEADDRKGRGTFVERVLGGKTGNQKCKTTDKNKFGTFVYTAAQPRNRDKGLRQSRYVVVAARTSSYLLTKSLICHLSKQLPARRMVRQFSRRSGLTSPY